MNREETIFEQALGIDSPAEREAWLREACAGDEPLFQSLRGLLRVHDRAGKFLDPAPQESLNQSIGAALGPMPVQIAEKPGDRIGRYKLLEKIGEGGCGVVYMAEQEEPVRRRVALKVIKLGMDTEAVIARFEAERQALALMDHPNIAKVLDAGATENPHPASGHPLPSDGRGAGGEGSAHIPAGRPYFVMELVRGTKITEFCDHNNLTTPQRLDLFMQVCRAIQHAHQKGIIHRDIKPSNILVTLHDGIPVPKVIDFGIAKATQGRLTDKTVFTAFQQFLGTPAYMSPEQAEMSGLDTDTRSDIYSLGVLLYELLTGKTPFDSKELMEAGLDAMRRTICEQEPQRPSAKLSTMVAGVLTTTANRRQTEPPKLLHAVRGDLDWIVMKALEKDRVRRYETANGLATDLQRHLDNEPVVARPPSNLYRLQKMVQRNKLAFAAALGVGVSLLFGVGFSTWMYFRERVARHEQVSLRREAESARNAEALQRQVAQSSARTAQTNESNARSEAAKSEQSVRFLKEMLKGVGPSKALGRDTTMLREILDETAERVGKELTNQPEVEMKLLATLSDTYSELGDFERAEAIGRRATEIGRSHFSADNLAMATALANLAFALVQRGNSLEEAEQIASEALRIHHKLSVTGSVEMAEAFRTLSIVLLNKGHLAEAEAAGWNAVNMHTKFLGGYDHETANSLRDLGLVLLSRGKLPEAERALEQALTLDRILFGISHPSVAPDLHFLALVRDRQGRRAEAEALDVEALAIKCQFLGLNHPSVSTSLYDLAMDLEADGKLPQAEQLYREALRVSRARLGDEHPEVLHCEAYLAKFLSERGALSEADALLCEALATYRKLSREGVWRAQVSADPLSCALMNEGRFQEAEDLQRGALALMRAKLGENSLEVAQALAILSSLLAAERKFPEAEVLQRDALERTTKILGQEHPKVALYLNNLGIDLLEQGKFEQAEVPLRQALALDRTHFVTSSPAIAGGAFVLATDLESQRKFPEAEALFREALEIQRKGPPGIYPTFKDCCPHLVEVLMLQGKSEAVEQLFDQFSAPDKTGKQNGALILMARGEFRAQRSKWKEAAADLEHALELDQSNPKLWHGLSAVLVHTGQVQAYCEHCSLALKRFHKSKFPYTCRWIAEDCVILPSSGADLCLAENVVWAAITAQKESPDLPWFQLTQSLVEYRLGNFDSAMDLAAKSLAEAGTKWSLLVEGHAVLAMTWQQLNRTEQARAAVASGAELAAAKLPKDGDLGSDWRETVFAQALLAEARQLIEGAAPGPLVQGPETQNQDRADLSARAKPGSEGKGTKPQGEKK